MATKTKNSETSTETTEAPMFHWTTLQNSRANVQKQVDYSREQLQRIGEHTDIVYNTYTPEQLKQEYQHLYNTYVDDLSRLEELKNTEDRVEPLEPLLKQVNAWPEVISAEHYHTETGDHLRLTFVPILVAELATTCLNINIDSTGSVYGGDRNQWHPHVLTSSICLGDAEYILGKAAKAQDLLGVLTIIRQMIQGHNPDSELDANWKRQAWKWWTREVYGQPSPIDGWDGHTVLDPETGKVGFVEAFENVPLKTILSRWSENIDTEDREDEYEEDACSAHCDACESCLYEDYVLCDECDDYTCEWHCLTQHWEEAHEKLPCLNPKLVRHNGQEEFYTETCELCDDHFCKSCMLTHLEQDHEEEEEEEEEEQPADSIPTPLPDQPALPHFDLPGPCDEPCTEWRIRRLHTCALGQDERIHELARCRSVERGSDEVLTRQPETTGVTP